MKHKILSRLTLLLVLIATAFTQGSSQTIPFVSSIEYDMLTKEYSTFPAGMSLNELNIIELHEQKPIIYDQHIARYFNDNNHYEQKTTYHFQQNLYPNWYVLPTEINYNQNGIEQIFATKSSLFRGGWFGHHNARNNPEQGSLTYSEETWNNNQNVGFIRSTFDLAEFNIYNEANSTYEEHGMLLSYMPPTNTFEGYTHNEQIDAEHSYREGPTFKQIYHPNKTITWYINDNVLETIYLENGEITAINIKRYSYHPEFNALVVFNEKNITTNELENGICSEKVVEYFYRNYRSDNIEHRSSVDVQDFEVKVYPNPTAYTISIDLSEYSVNSTFPSIELSLFDQQGIQQRRVSHSEYSESNLLIDMENLPAGPYTLILQIGDKVINKQIIKI